MDAFWLIPVAIIAIAFVIAFYAYLRTRPLPPTTPHVLVHKPPDEQPKDTEKPREWSGRPCGSFLDWLSGRD
jgi:hypothetical protein